MTDFITEINEIKKLIASKEIERAKLEQKLEDLDKQKKEITKQLEELNIGSIEELQETINILEKEITEGVEKCNTILS